MFQVDLRPPEFIREREFYWPRLLLILSCIFYIFIIIMVGFSLYYYKLEKEAELKMLREEYRLILLETGKWEEKTNFIDLMKQSKEELEGIIKADDDNWYPYLDLIFNAAGTDIYIDSFKGKENGNFIFTARTREMGSMVRYLNHLKETEKFAKILFKNIKKSSEGYFDFSLEGELNVFMEFENHTSD